VISVGYNSRRFAVPVAVATILLWCGWVQPSEAHETGGEPYVYEQSAINPGLSSLESAISRGAPRAALDFFFTAIDNNEPSIAAHILNLGAIPEDEQAQNAPDLALMLAYLIRRHDLVDWGDLSDEPDALVLPGPQSTLAPYSRRSVELGEIMLDGRPIPVNLQRFQAGADEPVWLFSPTLLERVPALYMEATAGWIGRWVPVRQRLATLGRPSTWEWTVVAATLLASVVVWFAVLYSGRHGIRHFSRQPTRRSPRTVIALATFVAAVVFRIGALNMAALTGPITSKLDILSEILVLASGAWLFLRLLSALTLWLSERYVVPLSADVPENRKTKTNVYVVRRLGMVVVTILAAGYILMTLGAFDTFALSLLASAGALGVVLAIAAQPVLGNMVAGLQIALTDPVRIGDLVAFDDLWGTVEDIAFAHTVIRTSTDTRLIVPHSQFLSRAFENWSKDGEMVRSIVKIPVDFRVDMDIVREKVRDILRDDPRVVEPPLIELTEADGNSATVWIWMMATDGFTVWYLHNEVREKVIAFLRDHEGGRFLPRQRHLASVEELT